MRLRACLGMLLLGLGGCAHLPAYLSLDIDGSTIEFKKKPAAEMPETNAAETDDAG